MPLREIPEELTITERVVTNLIDSLANQSPHVVSSSLDSGPGTLPQECKDLPYFFVEMNRVLADYQNRLNIVLADRVELSEEYPPVDLKTEVITYRLIARVPATVSPARPDIDMGSGARHEWVPRARYIKENPEKPNHRTVIMGQLFDNVVEFCCWAKTNKVADQRSFWLQDLLNIYRFYFKLRGFPEVIFQSRLEDFELEGGATAGNRLRGRPLRYLVRTDRTFAIYEPVLRDIVINLALSST